MLTRLALAYETEPSRSFGGGDGSAPHSYLRPKDPEGHTSTPYLEGVAQKHPFHSSARTARNRSRYSLAHGLEHAD